jgi:hypothetical protein
MDKNKNQESISPAGAGFEIKKIIIDEGFSYLESDRIQLFTNLPAELTVQRPTVGQQVFTFQVAGETGEAYVKKFFPGVPYEVNPGRCPHCKRVKEKRSLLGMA